MAIQETHQAAVFNFEDFYDTFLPEECTCIKYYYMDEADIRTISGYVSNKDGCTGIDENRAFEIGRGFRFKRLGTWMVQISETGAIW